ncbi:OmpA family protein [Telmatobacter sp. DSM 110680]|uniref:OmpA family protein n=1 Tax=Telmatobacter sp. DSM 110680 TaxID=3036704 RepID=A0AAU7DLV5_9BACT
MNRAIALSIAITLLGAGAASGQQTAFDQRSQASSSQFDLAAGYNLVNANAPPGDCGCFTMNGGFAGGQLNFSRWLGVAGEFSAGHASHISSLGQDLTLTTFIGGPRISWPRYRAVPFGEFFVGGAHGGGSYFPSSTSSSTSATSFAYTGGGGLDFSLNDRFAIRAFDAKYLHTALPNGVNGSQRQLQISVGLVMHFGGSGASTPPSAAVTSKAPRRISLSCSVSNQLVAAGQPVHIMGETSLDPDLYPVAYNWATSGGDIHGNGGSVITIDTANLKPGTYQVDGRAALSSNPSNSSSCKVTFQITGRSEGRDQILTTKFAAPPSGSYDEGARENLRDLFFNYDQADLRPDALNAIREDAAYLIAHPSIVLTIAGYADERGSAEYNVALGMERATAARDALASIGVTASRMHVISYGKERSFCSEDAESCYQQNRRAQLLPEAQ